jgi:hypothetical protein
MTFRRVCEAVLKSEWLLRRVFCLYLTVHVLTVKYELRPKKKLKT